MPTSGSNSPSDRKDTSDVDDDYQNRLDNVPRWRLSVSAAVIRCGATLGHGFANFSVRAATRDIWLDTTLASQKSKIRVDIWYPPGVSASSPPSKSRPALINFHGGGFILGQGTDDARWAAEASERLDAVVFSVNYRLAPACPFPTPVEDCADSILHIVSRAQEFGIDPDRVLLSGFSAGGNLALASWTLLNHPHKWGYNLPHTPSIAGFSLFYPPLTFTNTRSKKVAACSRPDLTLSSALTDLIDASYIHPPIPTPHRTDLRMSPGLMEDEILEGLPPMHFCLCEHDMLAAEALHFIERAKTKGKEVSTRTVVGEQHAWDKMPTFYPKPNVGEEYEAALKVMAGWI